MFGHETITSLLFKALNFGVLIGLCAYIFKRFVLNSLQQQMAFKEQSLQRIKDYKEQLYLDRKAVEEQIQQQERLCMDLMHKIERWHTFYQNERQQQFQDQKKLNEQLLKKVAEQEKNHELFLLTKKVLPKAAEELAFTLPQQLSAQQEGVYINQILKYMGG